MPANGIETYFETLTRGEKLQFILDYNIVDGQTVLSDEQTKEKNELTRQFFTPKTPYGELDTTEMKSRFGALLFKKADLEAEFGKEVLKQMSTLPADLTDEEKEIIAIEKTAKTTVVGYQLRKINSFVKNEIFDKNLLTRDEINAFLKANDIKVKTARTEENVPAAEQANKDALLAKMDSVYKDVKKIKNSTLDADGKKAYALGGKYPVNISSLSPDKQKLAAGGKQEKIDSTYSITDYAMELRNKIEAAAADGRTREALRATIRPVIISGVNDILHSTGRGDAWWHQNNSKEFEKVLTANDTYVEALNKGDNEFDIGKAKTELIQAGLKYIDGKESVRSSQFGKDRFDAVLTSLAVTMDAADFQKVADKINKKRGVSKGDPDYVSRDLYIAKASVLSRRVPGTVDIDQKYLREMLAFGPVPFSKEDPDQNTYDLNEMKGIGNKPLNSRDFAVLANGAKLMGEKEPKAVAYEALAQYGYGNKEPLAKLIAGSLTAYAKQTNAQDDLSKDKWVLNGEKMATLHEFLANDEELANLSMKAGLNEATLRYSQGAVEAAKIKGKAEIAKERIKTQKDLSDTEKRNLYVDIMKEQYLDSQIALENNTGDALGIDRDLIDAEKAFFGNKADQEKAKEYVKGEKREFSSTITELRNVENRRLLTAACKNAAMDFKPEKLSFDKAAQKMSNAEFNNRTIKKAIANEAEVAKKGAGMGGPK